MFYEGEKSKKSPKKYEYHFEIDKAHDTMYWVILWTLGLVHKINIKKVLRYSKGG